MDSRLPKALAGVAIFGRSCTGKTSAGAVVSARTGWQARHCGDVVVERARTAGVPVPELRESEHRSIDEETRLFVSSAESPVVVDGCFLDRVLRAFSNLQFVRLDCGDAERARRFAGSPTELEQRDELDLRLSSALYGGVELLVEPAVIDTTHLSVDRVADEIIKLLR